MAEFCLDCYNKLSGEHLTKYDVTLDMDFCEECCEIKPCIGIIIKRRSSFGWIIKKLK